MDRSRWLRSDSPDGDMMNILCATKFLLQARDTKVNNIEDGTGEQAEFIGDQKRGQTGESRRLSRGDAVSACRKGGERAGRASGQREWGRAQRHERI